MEEDGGQKTKREEVVKIWFTWKNSQNLMERSDEKKESVINMHMCM